MSDDSSDDEDGESDANFWSDLIGEPGKQLPKSCKPTTLVDQRLVLHLDIDSFYCAVERLDEPALINKPIAVEQFNSGGFVAVSYEAKAEGVRKGDGVGAGGRAGIRHLREMTPPSRSVRECKQVCQGLQIRPMRSERYREIAAKVHNCLKSLLPHASKVGAASCPLAVEKASYDDYYIDLSRWCCTDAGWSEWRAWNDRQGAVTQMVEESVQMRYYDHSNSKSDSKSKSASSEWTAQPVPVQRAARIGIALCTGLKRHLDADAPQQLHQQ